MKSLVFIGSGNVATQMSVAFKEANFDVRQVYSHSEKNARLLGEILHCDYTDKLSEIKPDSDVYIFSVKDSTLQDVISKVPKNKGLWLHTSGSIDMNVFDGYAEHFGVLYPLMTVSKNCKLDFAKIPLCIEGNTEESEKQILELSGCISNNCFFISSEKRRYLHLAAVFANNFTNRLYAIAADILEKQGIDYKVLLPIIDETAAKIHQMSPQQAQTGPAVRYDSNVIDKHLEMMDDEHLRKIYEIMTTSIHNSQLTKEHL